MARKKRNEIAQTDQLFSRQRWRLIIRDPEFWKDLSHLRENYFLFFWESSQRDQEKFGEMACRHLAEHEALEKRFEDKWEIAPIPMWAILLGAEHPTRALIEKLEGMYKYDDNQRPSSYPPVSVLKSAGFRLIDLRLDLTRPLHVLMAGVEAEIKKFGITANRSRVDKVDDYLAVWDLRQEGLTAEEIALKLWPTEYEQKGGRDDIGGKSALSQRVYDYESAARKLIDGSRPENLPAKIKK